MAKNWLDKYNNGGETPANYNSIPTGIVKPPTVIPTSGSSYYEPSEQTIYLNPTAYYKDPSVYQHEMFHHWQNLNDQLRKPDEYQGPLAKPNMLSNNTGDYYNRRTVETDKEYNDFYKDNPTFKVVNPNLIYNGVINPSLYENPKYAEGEAEDYQYYVKGGGRPAFMAKGGLIKRADGSYSRRGLWDNIRANRGSGRKPTAEMLRQERKISKKEDGGWIDMYADGDVVTGENPPSKLQELAAQYQVIQEQVNKGDIGKKAYLDKMRSIADDLVAKGFTLEDSGIVPKSVYEHSTSTGSCIGTACYIADQAGDKFYPQGSSFFTSNSKAQDYAKDNPNASRYLEQNEKYISPTDIIQFKSGEKGRPYHAYTVYDIGEPNEEGDRIITVVGSPGHGPVHKKTYVLGKDNKIYGDQYGSKGLMLDTQLLKRREDNTEYNNLLSQRDALKQEILGIDPQYFTPKQDIRSGDYKQTAFMLNDQGQGNEYGQYVQTEDLGADRYGNKLVPGVNIQTLNPGMVDQAYNARSYIDATNSGLTDILTKYSDPQYKYDYMRSHNISNNEYDALVSNMVGIYGAETKFGTDYVGKEKKVMGVKVPAPEWPWATKLADKLGIINQEEKSIGPFQLTYNQLPEAYRKTIKGHDLYDANIAADATMEYLTAGLPLLRKRANTTAETATEDNPYSQNITKDNYLEYVPYLYNMRGWLKGDESTMEKKGDILRGDSGYKQLVDQYRNNVLQILPSNLTTPQPIEAIPQQRNGGYIQKPCCDGNMYGDGGWIDMYNDGSWVENMSIPTPTSPSFYDVGEDRTLTNYQMGTPKARMYGKGSVVGGPGNGVAPFITSDPNLYKQRLQAYNDSVYTHNLGLANLKYAQSQLKQNVDKFNAQLPSAFGNIIGSSISIAPLNRFHVDSGGDVIRGIYPTEGAFQETNNMRWTGQKDYFNLYNNPSYYRPMTPDELSQYTQLRALQPVYQRGHYFPYKTRDIYHTGYINLYDAPKQKVIFDKNAPKPPQPEPPHGKEYIEPIKRNKTEFKDLVLPTEEYDMQSVREEPSKEGIKAASQPMLRMVPNPKFNAGKGKRTKEAVVDELGNPKNVYYYGDKVISKEEYSKLWDAQNNKFAQGGLVEEEPPIDPYTGKPAILLPEVKVIGKRNNKIDSTNVRESTAVNIPKFNDKIVNNIYDEDGWRSFDYDVAYANKLLKDYDVKVDSTGNILDDIGLPSGAYYNPITRTINYKSNAKDSNSANYRYARTIMEEIPHTIQADSMGTIPFLINIGLQGLNDPSVNRYRTKGTLEHEAHRIIAPKLKDALINKSIQDFQSLDDNFNFYTPAKKQYGGPIDEQGKKVNTLEGDMIANVLMNRNRNKDFVQRAYAVGENPNSPMFNLFDPEEFGSKMSHKMGWGEDDSGQTWMYPSVMNPKDEAIKVPRQYADYISKEGYKNATGIPMNAMGGPVMYGAGSTVWTKQDSALWVNGGKEIGTQDKRYPSRNTGSLDPDHYTIGDVIATGMDYKTPSAGTYDYNKDVQPYHTMRLNAPDTLRIGNVQMGKHGGYVKNNNSNTWLDTYN